MSCVFRIPGKSQEDQLIFILIIFPFLTPVFQSEETVNEAE